MYFGNYRLGKTWLDKWLKSPISEDPSGGDIANEPKYNVEIWRPLLLLDLMITMKVIEIDKVSLRDMQNLSTVC